MVSCLRLIVVSVVELCEDFHVALDVIDIESVDESLNSDVLLQFSLIGYTESRWDAFIEWPFFDSRDITPSLQYVSQYYCIR